MDAIVEKKIRIGTWVQSQTSGNVYIITAIEFGVGGQVYARQFGTDFSFAIGNNTDKYTVI